MEPGWNYTTWNRAKVSAYPEQVEAKKVVIQMGDAILEWTEMDMKVVPKSNGEKIKKLFNRVGI